ncbi:MAG: hypothetical protein KME27_16420 [Lyngbya sp. HA4199-MV5]|nr:hypothetical protein [Lyngbya sp. HA4199-MV5]
MVSPQMEPSTESLQPNRVTQAVVIVVATVMGLTVFSGMAYIALMKLDILQRSQPSSTQPTPPKRTQDEQIIPPVENPIQVQKSNEMQATMFLDRARRLAVANRFEDAIAEANKVPFDSLLYPETRQAITQWSEQVQQQEAEQRAIQQSNEQHLQVAQQALEQNDWKTALQAVNQLNIHATNQNAFWQQQKDAMVQTIEPYQHEHKAREFLDQGELENAVYEAKQLPSIAPWQEKKALIIEQVTQKFADKAVAKKWNERCQTLTQGNISRCPYLDDVKEIVHLLPSTRWLPGLNSPRRKSRH